MRPRLIMLGTDMLEKGGLEFILTLRARRDLRHASLIVLTTSDSAVQRLQAHGVPTGLHVSTPEQLKDLDQFLDDASGVSTLTVVRLPPEESP